MKKRVLSLLLCLSFVLALVPAAAMAADAADPLQPDDLYYSLTGQSTSGEKPDITLHKTAVDNGDGTYNITLTAEAVETVSTRPTEVVFLLDTSGSMNWCADGRGGKCDKKDSYGVHCTRVDRGETDSRLTKAKAAIATVVSNLSKNDDTTVKYAYFGGHQEWNGQWVYDAMTVENYDGITTGNGGTPLTLGTETALNLFSNDDHNKVLIIVADGASDDKYPNQQIQKFKDAGGIVYTVGFTFSSSDFTALASKDGNYTANNADELQVAMNEITTKVAGLISDTMGDGVDLVPGTVKQSGEGYDNAELWTSEDGRTIYWTNKDGLSNKITLTYTVKLTDAAKESAKENGADIPLNKNATLNYELGGEVLHLPFPVPVAHVDRELKNYTLTYVSNGGTEFEPETYKEGTVVGLSNIPTKTDYQFTGWYEDEACTTLVTKVTMDQDRTVYAGWKKDETPVLEKGDHSAYIIGYDDGTVRPDRSISRAEVATIFFRLLTDETREQYWADTNNYSDVEDTVWYNNAISTLSKMGILTGYEDGTFKPDAPVTRAEFATIAARFSDGELKDFASFPDVPEDHWASKYIAKAEKLGWIKGYVDGTFRPENNITRAEAMTFVNRVLERGVDEEGICEDTIQWSDNLDTTAWYYYAVQEATNSHEYARTDREIEDQSFCYEEWTKLKENRNWADLEKAWKEAFATK